jgi:hypothetical protein
MYRRMTGIAVLCGLVGLAALTVAATTADEILDKVENLFSINTNDARGLLTTMTLHNDYSGGVNSEYTLAMLELTQVDSTKPETADETSYVLMYFLGGDEDGSIFLLKTPEDTALKSQMWLYLPALGLTKELVSDQEQSGSFAGSSLSYGDLGGMGNLRDDYDATILREEAVDIAGEPFNAWVLELLAKPDADPDYARVLLWVSKEDYLTLRMESYNDSGTLESTMEFRALTEFEGDRIPATIDSTNEQDGTSTTITISGTRRPDSPLTPEVFDPNTLGQFDPTAYGF